MRAKFSTLLLSVLLLTALTVAPASAGEPAQFEYDMETWTSVDCTVYGFDFTISEKDVTHPWGSSWFDNYGLPEKIVEHMQGTAYLTNTNTGAQLTYQIQYTSHYTFYSWDPFEATVMFTGVGVNLQLPGEGTVLHDAGMASFDLATWLRLQHTGLNMFDWPTVCLALNG